MTVTGVGRAAAAALVAFLLLLAAGGGLAAHEEAVLDSPVSSVPAGGTLLLSGSDFGAEEEYALRLLGTLEEHELGPVRSDDEGRFELEVAIPDAVRPGSYRLVAVAPDGDVAASLDLTVLPARRAAEGRAGGPGAARDGGTPAPRAATDEEIRIERSRSGVEWGVIGLIVGLAGGLGLGILLRGGTRS